MNTSIEETRALHVSQFSASHKIAIQVQLHLQMNETGGNRVGNLLLFWQGLV